MNNVKNFVAILLSVVIAAVALPGNAAPQYTKQYTLSLTSSPSAPLTVVAHLTNQALGPGNSNVGSFRFTFSGATINPAPGSVTTNPAVPAANITVSGSTVTVVLSSPLKAQKTIDVTILLQDCGDGITLPLSGVQVWTGNQGQAFTPTATTFPLTTSVVCGVLACGDNATVPDSFNPGTVTVTRGIFDKNGDVSTAACAGLPYTYTTYAPNTCPNTSAECLHFAWPDTITGNPHAAFELVLDVAGPAPSPGVTGVSWLNVPSTTNPKFISGAAIGVGFETALNCLTPDLPAPYGTLATAVNDTTDNQITINGVVTLPSLPFPVVIINDSDPNKNTERMTAVSLFAMTGAGPYTVTYDVTRDSPTEGYPTTGNKRNHAAGANVMSTPLPILPGSLPGSLSPPYTASTQVQICIVDQIPAGSDHITTFISIGDPWGSQP